MPDRSLMGLLKELNFSIKKCHLNEGHSSLLTLELLKDNNMNSNSVRNLCVFRGNYRDLGG
jgi:starch phosphorylase